MTEPPIVTFAGWATIETARSAWGAGAAFKVIAVVVWLGWRIRPFSRLVPLYGANDPETDAKVMILNELPLTGENPLMSEMLTVPARTAAPVTFNWSKSVPAVIPPSSISSDPVLVCV